MTDGQVLSRRRWVILAVGTATQASTASFLFGIALIVPALRRADHLSLVQASIVISAPTAGLLLTLIAWGAAADRYGERVVLALGVGLSAVFLAVASAVHGALWLSAVLVLAGAAAGSVNAASGRMVMGWFSIRERGLAMGTRQTAQPLGLAISAVLMPPLAQRYGAHAALLGPATLCLLAAVAVLVFVADPPRPAAAPGSVAARSPYRGQWVLWRIHAASSLLVIPQFAVSTFTLVYLVGERHWDPIGAGRVIFAFQVAGALARIASGVWSDRVGTRLGPMRILAVLSALLILGLAAGAWTGSWWVVVAFGAAAVVTVADNGLAFTAVAEIAGAGWAGRALGAHNTAQSVASISTPPVLALVIATGGYGWAFALAGVAAVVAVPLTPVHGERSGRARAAAQA